MITENLKTNQLSTPAYERYLAYLEALDARDMAAYAEFLADDVSIQFGNTAPVQGKDAVTGMLGGYWQSFAGLEHDLINIYGTDQSFVLEALNHYARHDGKSVTVRAVAFTDVNEDGLVEAIRVYGDTTPVFAD